MNPFVVEAAVEAVVVVVVEAVVVMEEVVVEVAVMEVEEEVMEDTVMEVADTVADIMEEVMAVDGVAGAVGVAGLSMDGLIAAANPVLIIFSKSLNDHPFSQ